MGYKIERSTNYQAAEHTVDGDVEHKNFKYAKKEFKNGKWVYYYLRDGQVFKQTSGKNDGKYGTYVHGSGQGRKIVQREKSDKLLSKTETQKTTGGTTIKKESVGLIEQNKDWTVNKIKNAAEKGRKKLEKKFKIKSKKSNSTSKSTNAKKTAKKNSKLKDLIFGKEGELKVSSTSSRIR